MTAFSPLIQLLMVVFVSSPLTMALTTYINFVGLCTTIQLYEISELWKIASYYRPTYFRLSDTFPYES